MMKTIGNDGLSIWDHGVKVKNILLDVYLQLKKLTLPKNQTYLDNIKIEVKDYLKSKYNIPEYIVDNYTYFYFYDSWKDIRIGVKFHDCGKPFCITTDNNGQKHFPNHRKLSIEKFKEYEYNLDIKGLHISGSTYRIKDEAGKYLEGPNYLPNRELTHYIIENDMYLHLMSSNEESIKKYLFGESNKSIYYSNFKKKMLMILLAMCEANANFDKDSIRYKIAMKKFTKIGDKCIKLYKEQKTS